MRIVVAMKIKSTLLRVATTTAAVALLASCGTGGDGGDGSASEPDQTAAVEAQAPAYESLDDVVAAVSTAADCDEERWETKKTSRAADSDTGMPAVDYTLNECSLAGDEDAHADVWVYFAPLGGTSAEMVQAFKVRPWFQYGYVIQGDRWAVLVHSASVAGPSDSGGREEEEEAYAKKFTETVKPSLDENAPIVYIPNN